MQMLSLIERWSEDKNGFVVLEEDKITNGGIGSGNRNPGQGWGPGKPGIGTLRRASLEEQVDFCVKAYRNRNKLPEHLDKENVFQIFSYFVGNNSKPELVSEEKFSRYDPRKYLYRTVKSTEKTSREIIDDIKEGDYTYQGAGDYYSGIYFSDKESSIETYSRDENGNLVKDFSTLIGVLKPDTKLHLSQGKEPDSIMEKFYAINKALSKTGAHPHYSEVKSIAVMLDGYDGVQMIKDALSDETYVCLFDRSKLITTK